MAEKLFLAFPSACCQKPANTSLVRAGGSEAFTKPSRARFLAVLTHLDFSATLGGAQYYSFIFTGEEKQHAHSCEWSAQLQLGSEPVHLTARPPAPLRNEGDSRRPPPPCSRGSCGTRNKVLGFRASVSSL